MNPKTKKILIFAIAIAVLIWLSYKFVFKASASVPDNSAYANPPAGTSLLDISPQADTTTVRAYSEAETGRNQYSLTYTFPKTGRGNPTAQTKQLTVNGYLNFINDYPSGAAKGNVLNSYN